MCDDTNRNFLQMRSSCGISIVVIVCNHLQRLTLAVSLACKVNIYTRACTRTTHSAEFPTSVVACESTDGRCLDYGESRTRFVPGEKQDDVHP